MLDNSTYVELPMHALLAFCSCHLQKTCQYGPVGKLGISVPFTATLTYKRSFLLWLTWWWRRIIPVEKGNYPQSPSC